MTTITGRCSASAARADAGTRNVAPAAAFDWLARRLARLHDRSGGQPRLRAAGLSGLRRHRRRPVLLRLGLHPVPGLRRLHGGRPDHRGRPLRKEPAHRSRQSRSACAQMIFVRPESGGQILFAGVLLCLLTLLWMRAAVIIYALFFGLRPFPGLDHIVPMLFTTTIGWAMLVVGSAVGGLFAAFRSPSAPSPSRCCSTSGRTP